MAGGVGELGKAIVTHLESIDVKGPQPNDAPRTFVPTAAVIDAATEAPARDAYHVGQIGLSRRFADLGA